MSLDARNITQGGQVIKYMIGMFIQITNIVVYWSLIPTISAFFIYLFSVMKWVHIKHGAVYWLIRLKKHYINGATDEVYHFDWITAKGETVEFTRTAAQILNDNYFIQCAEKLKIQAFLAWGVALLVFFLFICGVFWFLGRKGYLQRKDELIGGRFLAPSAAYVNKLLKKAGKLSPLKIGDLHLVKNSEIQNIALHGTVGTGSSSRDKLPQGRYHGSGEVARSREGQLQEARRLFTDVHVSRHRSGSPCAEGLPPHQCGCRWVQHHRA